MHSSVLYLECSFTCVAEELSVSRHMCNIESKLQVKLMSWLIQRSHLRSHALVCIGNHLFIVGIVPIMDKEL